MKQRRNFQFNVLRKKTVTKGGYFKLRGGNGRFYGVGINIESQVL